MTLLEDLIDGSSGDSVPVATLLRKVKVLAARLKTVELAEWVDHELLGYPTGAQVPEYRGPFETEVLGNFSGPFGSGLQNYLIPSLGFPAEYRKGYLFNIQFLQPIAEIESLGGSDEPLQAPWPANAVVIINNMIQRGEVRLYEGMGLQQAWRSISKNQLQAIVDSVRTRILELALSLEAIAPDAGQRDASTPDPARLQQIVTNVYGGSPNIAVASSQFEQTVSLPAQGDLEALAELLSRLGVTDDEIEDLRSALDADNETPTPGELGVSTSSWLGRVVARISTAGVDVMTGAGGALVAQAVISYLLGPHPH